MKRSLSFRKVEVSSPIGKKFLRLSKAIMKGILIFYGGLIVIGSVVAGIANYYLNQYQALPVFFGASPFGFDTRILLKSGLYNEHITKKLVVANEYYMVFLRYINREHGLKYDKDLEVLPEFLSNEQIAHKGKAWYDLYVDVMFRTAIVKGQLGQLDDARVFLEKSVSFIDAVNKQDPSVGTAYLRNNGYRLLAKIYEIEDFKNKQPVIETLYKNAIKALLPVGAYTENGSNGTSVPDIALIDDRKAEYLTRDLYNSVNELAVFYSKSGAVTRSFKIFLNNLFFLKSFEPETPLIPKLLPLLDEYYDNVNTAQPFSRAAGDIPLLKYYVSEILWAKGQTQSAVNWTKEALIEAYNYSRQDKNSAIVAELAVTNLIRMYRHLNVDGRYDDKIKNCEKMASDIYIPMETPSGWKILFDNML